MFRFLFVSINNRHHKCDDKHDDDDDDDDDDEQCCAIGCAHGARRADASRSRAAVAWRERVDSIDAHNNNDDFDEQRDVQFDDDIDRIAAVERADECIGRFDLRINRSVVC
jgi:hypothetical protein